MAAASLIYGGGGQFRLRSRISSTIASGVTGNILSVNAPVGQVARLVLLVCSSASTQAGISVIADSNSVLTGTLSQNDVLITAGTYFISDSFSVTTPAGTGSKSLVSAVVGNQIIVQKNAGNTATSIEYVVEFGVVS